jgi:hypothetical protein
MSLFRVSKYVKRQDCKGKSLIPRFHVCWEQLQACKEIFDKAYRYGYLHTAQKICINWQQIPHQKIILMGTDQTMYSAAVWCIFLRIAGGICVGLGLRLTTPK